MAASSRAATSAAGGNLVGEIFLPFAIEAPAISPDGRHRAYVWREGRTSQAGRIVVFALDHPGPKVEFRLEERGPPQVRSLT